MNQVELLKVLKNYVLPLGIGYVTSIPVRVQDKDMTYQEVIVADLELAIAKVKSVPDIRTIDDLAGFFSFDHVDATDSGEFRTSEDIEDNLRRRLACHALLKDLKAEQDKMEGERDVKVKPKKKPSSKAKKGKSNKMTER